MEFCGTCHRSLVNKVLANIRKHFPRPGMDNYPNPNRNDELVKPEEWKPNPNNKNAPMIPDTSPFPSMSAVLQD